MSKKRISDEDKQVLVDLVREEIEDYQNGKIDSFLTQGELAELIGMKYGGAFTKFFSTILTPDQKDYRKKRTGIGKNSTGIHTYRDRESIVDLVREEIESHKKGIVKHITSSEEFGELLGVTQPMAAFILRDDLNSDEREYRKENQYKERVKRYSDSDKEIVLDLVREEIENHKKGLIKNISNAETLSELIESGLKTVW